jgi:hypothetical protein
MQIDDSNEQSANAKTGIEERVDPNSNATLETWEGKQATPNCLILFGIVTAAASPRYRLIDIDFESRRKSPTILKVRFSPREMPFDDNDEQPTNAKMPMNESRESDSNTITEREEQRQKQDRPIRSTVEGTEMYDSDEQVPNAEYSMCESLEPVSNVTLERPDQ